MFVWIYDSCSSKFNLITIVQALLMLCVKYFMVGSLSVENSHEMHQKKKHLQVKYELKYKHVFIE